MKRLEDQTTHERYAALRSALGRATQLEKAGETVAAQKIRDAARELYNSDPGAKRLLDDAGK